jgi:hypothetical protein
MATSDNAAVAARLSAGWPRRLVALLWLGVLALAGVLGACGEPSANCTAPPASFGSPVVSADHQEIAVHFTCEGAVQAATLYLPLGHGPHPAVVWIHGAGEARRLLWGPLVSLFIQSGVAVLSFDKRESANRKGPAAPATRGSSTF